MLGFFPKEVKEKSAGVELFYLFGLFTQSLKQNRHRFQWSNSDSLFFICICTATIQSQKITHISDIDIFRVSIQISSFSLLVSLPYKPTFSPLGPIGPSGPGNPGTPGCPVKPGKPLSPCKQWHSQTIICFIFKCNYHIFGVFSSYTQFRASVPGQLHINFCSAGSVVLHI